MVDLRVDMVGTAGQDNAPMPGLLHPFQSLLALGFYISAHGGHLFPAGMAGFPDLLLGDLGEDLYQLIRQDLLAGESQEGIHKADLRIVQLIHVVLDILRV